MQKTSRNQTLFTPEKQELFPPDTSCQNVPFPGSLNKRAGHRGNSVTFPHEKTELANVTKVSLSTSLSLKFWQWNERVNELINLIKHSHDPAWTDRLAKELKKIRACGRAHLLFTAAEDEEMLARKRCCLSWCPFCGDLESANHKRMAGPGIDRLFDAPILHHAVFTGAPEFHTSHLGREQRTKITAEIIRLVKKYIPVDGFLLRWHLVPEGFGKLDHHAHVLAPQFSGRGFLGNPILDAVEKEWTNFINKMWKTSSPRMRPQISQRYEDRKKINAIWYVLRPQPDARHFQHLSKSDKKYVRSLKGTRFTRWCGSLRVGKYREYLASHGIEVKPKPDSVAPGSGEKWKYKEKLPAGAYVNGVWYDSDGRPHIFKPYNDEKWYSPKSYDDRVRQDLEKLQKGE